MKSVLVLRLMLLGVGLIQIQGEADATMIKKAGCNAKMDLVVLLDGSGSIGRSDFTRALNFIADLFGTYKLENIRMGLIVFSDSATVEIELDHNYKTINEIRAKVKRAKYPNRGTNTKSGINEVIQMYRRAKSREGGIPKVMALFTDGRSNDGVSNIVGAHADGIESFAVGIGNFHLPELEEITSKDSSRIFALKDFQSLTTAFSKRLNSETCEVPQSPPIDKPVIDGIAVNEKRTYKFQIPEQGITFELYVEEGGVVCYYSYGMTTTKPNATLHDGKCKAGGDGKTFIPAAKSKATRPEGKFVYISLTGEEEANIFTILAEVGDSSGVTSRIAPPLILFQTSDFLSLYS